MPKLTSLKESQTSTQPTTKQKKLKVSHYRDLFNQYFFTVFKRGLVYLYLPHADEDIYILSNKPPAGVLAEFHDMTFGVVDLSDADPILKDLVRNWLTKAFNGKDVCIRLDFFMQIVNTYFGPKIIPGQDLVITEKFKPSGLYPPMIAVYDDDNDHLVYQMSKTGHNDGNIVVAWDASESYSILPVLTAYRTYKEFMTPKDTILPIEVDSTYPKEYEEFTIHGKTIKYKPIVGLDVLQTNKLPGAKQHVLVNIVDNSAVNFGHLLEHTGVKVFIHRPNMILYPYIDRRKSQ